MQWLVTWLRPHRESRMMLMTGEKQLAPVWVTKTPSLANSLCFPRVSTPAASATRNSKSGLRTVTEPNVTEPTTVTEPTATEPTVTEPTVTEQTVTEQTVTESATVTESVKTLERHRVSKHDH